jgi:hypothetical protein
MSKLVQAVSRTIADGWTQVIVYNNGPRSMSQAAAGGWKGIAQAGAMIGLEAYTTTFWPSVQSLKDQYGFIDGPDVSTIISENPDLYTGFKDLFGIYVESAKGQLADPSLFDHLSLLQFEAMSYDIQHIQQWGWSLSRATHFAELWYQAVKDVAAEEAIHWGIYHPA